MASVDYKENYQHGDGVFPTDHMEHPCNTSNQCLKSVGDNTKLWVNPKKSLDLKQSFPADMFGFATNGEFSAISNYLKNHGGFELDEVSAGRALQAFVGQLCLVASCLLYMLVGHFTKQLQLTNSFQNHWPPCHQYSKIPSYFLS